MGWGAQLMHCFYDLVQLSPLLFPTSPFHAFASYILLFSPSSQSSQRARVVRVCGLPHAHAGCRVTLSSAQRHTPCTYPLARTLFSHPRPQEPIVMRVDIPPITKNLAIVFVQSFHLAQGFSPPRQDDIRG